MTIIELNQFGKMSRQATAMSLHGIGNKLAGTGTAIVRWIAVYPWISPRFMTIYVFTMADCNLVLPAIVNFQIHRIQHLNYRK